MPRQQQPVAAASYSRRMVAFPGFSLLSRLDQNTRQVEHLFKKGSGFTHQPHPAHRKPLAINPLPDYLQRKGRPTTTHRHHHRAASGAGQTTSQGSQQPPKSSSGSSSSSVSSKENHQLLGPGSDRGPHEGEEWVEVAVETKLPPSTAAPPAASTTTTTMSAGHRGRKRGAPTLTLAPQEEEDFIPGVVFYNKNTKRLYQHPQIKGMVYMEAHSKHPQLHDPPSSPSSFPGGRPEIMAVPEAELPMLTEDHPEFVSRSGRLEEELRRRCDRARHLRELDSHNAHHMFEAEVQSATQTYEWEVVKLKESMLKEVDRKLEALKRMKQEETESKDIPEVMEFDDALLGLDEDDEDEDDEEEVDSSCCCPRPASSYLRPYDDLQERKKREVMHEVLFRRPTLLPPPAHPPLWDIATTATYCARALATTASPAGGGRRRGGGGRFPASFVSGSKPGERTAGPGSSSSSPSRKRLRTEEGLGEEEEKEVIVIDDEEEDEDDDYVDILEVIEKRMEWKAHQAYSEAHHRLNPLPTQAPHSSSSSSSSSPARA